MIRDAPALRPERPAEEMAIAAVVSAASGAFDRFSRSAVRPVYPRTLIFRR